MICNNKKAIGYFPVVGIPAASAAIATSIVSSISSPLLTATITAISTFTATHFRNKIAARLGITDQEGTMGAMFATMTILPVLLSLASTAMGFPISIPLSLLLSVIAVVGTNIGNTCTDSL